MSSPITAALEIPDWKSPDLFRQVVEQPHDHSGKQNFVLFIPPKCTSSSESLRRFLSCKVCLVEHLSLFPHMCTTIFQTYWPKIVSMACILNIGLQKPHR